jgi:DNA-binding MarR family transcriptional regulator
MTEATKRDGRRPEAPFVLRASIKSELPDLDDDVVMLHLTLIQLGKLVQVPAGRVLAQDHLESSDGWVLIALLFSGAPFQLSPSILGRAIHQTNSGVSKTLRRLERRNMVTREPDPADGRGRQVRLTDAGVEHARTVLHRLAASWELQLADVGPSERAAMADTAWALLQRLDPSFEPGPGREP